MQEPASPIHPPSDSFSTPSTDPAGADELVGEVYDELRQLARQLVVRFRPGQTLQPTVLVHEAYLKLAKQKGGKWNGRRHFYAVAARAMRSVLIDSIRAKRAQKRTPIGGRIVALDELLASYEDRAVDLEGLDEALKRLSEVDPGLVERVELRFFAGLSTAEIGELMGVSQRTIERDLVAARHWLARAMR